MQYKLKTVVPYVSQLFLSISNLQCFCCYIAFLKMTQWSSTVSLSWVDTFSSSLLLRVKTSALLKMHYHTVPRMSACLLPLMSPMYITLNGQQRSYLIKVPTVDAYCLLRAVNRIDFICKKQQIPVVWLSFLHLLLWCKSSSGTLLCCCRTTSSSLVATDQTGIQGGIVDDMYLPEQTEQICVIWNKFQRAAVCSAKLYW